jgi:hypothetical protein
MLKSKLITLLALMIAIQVVSNEDYYDEGSNSDSPSTDDEYYNDDPDVTTNILEDILSGHAPKSNPSSYITETVKYNKNRRPKGIKNLNTNIDSKGALYIYLKLSLRQLISLEERNQIMTTSFFLMLSWNDPRLSWDPAQYNDSREIITNNANCKYL